MLTKSQKEKKKKQKRKEKLIQLRLHFTMSQKVIGVSLMIIMCKLNHTVINY